MIVVTILLIIVSLVCIGVSLLMSPDSNAFSGALVGSGDLELFKNSKERGIKKILKYTMLSAGILLFILSIVLRILIK
ncbi:preprotein translocase subunit SecG [Mycoplasmopsis columbina]|uniref:Protein-export membrane protein SecG n=1 Tax=Mycoplasmopsis columbina SF7 TaxID=1037410 RepID=F9UKQ2_9BACT|nr:preprotein translocase subunit SecG [Mycoplasmopsis columbina]EGV00257.1 preprotein translocase, SecG subunit [Mycoplasmopsis columbina SF7]VEU77146.1 preprotein translocase subunit SecG [Mycoplasmopsis columbina]